MNGCFRIGGAEYGVTGYEAVGSGFYKAGSVLDSDAAIDPDQGFQAPVMYHAAEIADLLEGMRNEYLSTKTGIDTHN